HDVVAVNQTALFITQQHAVGVAVVRDAAIRLVFDGLAAHRLGMHRAAIAVDVHAIGLVAIDDDFRAEFAQHAGGGFVGGAVRAIHDDAHPFERQAAREAGFGKFNVTPERVVNANRLADGVGGWADAFDLAAENQI